MNSFDSGSLSNSTKSKKKKYDDKITQEYDLNNTIKKEKNLQAYYQTILNEKKEKIKLLNEDLDELFQNRTNLNKEINLLENEIGEKKGLKKEISNNYQILIKKKLILNDKLCELDKENFLENLKIDNLNKETKILEKRYKEKKRLSDKIFKSVLEEKNSKLNNENLLNKILKKIKENRLKITKVDDLPENVLKISIMCQKIIKKFEIICEEIKNTPKNMNKMQINKKLTKIFDNIKDLKGKLLKESVNYNILEKKQEILNFIKQNTENDLKKLEENRTKNKILNEHALKEFYESKNKYLDLFSSELKILKEIQYPNDPEINQKMESIHLYIEDEKNKKINFQNFNIAKTMNDIDMVEEFKKQTTDSVVSDFDNISLISNIKSKLHNNLNLNLNNSGIYDQNMNKNCYSFTDRKPFLRESKSKPVLLSVRGDTNNNSLFKDSHFKGKKFTDKMNGNQLVDLGLYSSNNGSFKNVKSRNKNEEKILNEHWSKIVKTFMKIMNCIFKSSCLLAGNFFLVSKEVCKNEKKLNRSKNFINKFLKESMTRHKSSLSGVSAYRNLKNVPIKALLSCLNKFKEVVLNERKVQDKFSVSIYEFFGVKKK